MLDIKLVRENSKVVRDDIKKRGLDAGMLNSFLKLDEKWRNLKKDADNLRARRNKISQEINLLKKEGKSAKELINEAKQLPKKLQQVEIKVRSIEAERLNVWKSIPNLLDKSVPTGDESKNKVIKIYNKEKAKKGKIGHEEILTSLDLLDIKKASEVAGARFYYLKRELVKLNQALINFALDFLAKKGFTLIQPPFMLRREVLEGATTFDSFKEAIYKIHEEDFYLIGTAEHSLNALNFNEILDSKKIPMRFAGVSTCFRKEAGSHGKDTKGIFRVHQFEKVEQFSFCKPEESWKEFELLLKNSIEIYKKLRIPFRVVILSSKETSKTSTKTVDLEGWFPSQGRYRELGSCSNCLDYQARRSNIRYHDSKDNKLKFTHTLNNTAIATERMIACLVENNIQKDGSIKIPSCLWKYTGFQLIKVKKTCKK